MGNEENELPNESETKSESLNTDEDCEIECDKNDFKDKLKNTKKESKTSDSESKTESSEKDVLGSSAVKCVRDKKDFISEKKKAKIRKEYYANKAMLTTPDPLEDKRQRDNFAQAYFNKLKEILDIDDYYKVIDILKSSDLKTGDAVDLYRKLDPILRSKYQDLADEFLLFLNIEQANAIGKLLPYFIMNNMTEFLRKLDIYFKDQPSQIRKIYRSLIELNDSGEATLLKTKNMILPLLKGNPLLCDGFLQIFLEEKPPPTLLNGSDLWEFIDIKKEHSKNDEMTSFETISVEDTEDPYGGPTCVCTCHQTDEQQGAKSHCINCGLKFLQGKVYCQTPKGLKPVTVTFPHDKEVDHNVRLGVPGRIKKSETSPSKRQGSPSKEPIEEKLIANKKPKPKSKKQIFKEKESSKVFKKEIGTKKLGIIKSPPLKKRKSKIIKKADINKGKEICKKEDTEKPGHSSGQIKRTFTSVIDWKNMPSPDDIEVHTSDSESSQQEGISELKPTNINKNPSEESKSETDVWTREEDKIILETFQQNMENDALNVIADKLRSRSTEDIKKRFQILMSLLQEMTNS